MAFNLPLFPPQASTGAASVDALYFFFVAVTAFFSVLIAAMIVVFAIRFRRRTPDEVGAPIHGSLVLELTWTIIPLGIAMVMFVWGSSVYFTIATPPSNAMEIYVVGKRWMWKAQHVSGQREINELHVPVGQPVKLIIGSEDVIHAYYIPAFRMKMDAVPGRTTTMWFEADEAGDLPAVLRRVLRHEPLEDGRLGHGDGAGGFPDLARRRQADGHAGGAGPEALRRPGLRDLSHGDEPGPRTVAQRRVRPRGHARQRREGHGGRGLHPRIDADPGGEDGGRLPAADADLPGRHQRRAADAAHGLHQVAREPAGRGTGGACADDRAPRRRPRTNRPHSRDTTSWKLRSRNVGRTT